MEEEVAAKPGRSTLLQRAMSEEEYRSSITCRTEQIKREDIVNVIEALRLVVADTYALIGQAHICHWNVRGPSFFSLHTAFEEQYTELFLAVDEIAERIRAKGALAPGGLSNLSKMAGIDEINEDAAASDMVSHLVTANEKLLADLKIARDLASEEGDSESEDLMIARIQVHEKTVWMLKSYLE
jgi:starvation-inducible DNA-binding protein